MVDKLKLQVLLDMADRVSAPLKRIGASARGLSADVQQAQQTLRNLERQQATLARFKGMQENLRDQKSKLDAARQAQSALVAELKKGGDAAKAVAPEYRAANDAVNKLTASYRRQLDQVRQMRGKLTTMGVREVAADEAKLRAAIDRTTEALKRKQAAHERLAKLEASAARGAAMGGGMAAAGAVGMYTGKRVIDAGTSTAGDFMKHEDAMLGIARQVPGARDELGKLTPVYAAIEEQVRQLSTRVPLATTSIAEMFTAAARMEVPTDKLSDFVLMASEMATAFDAVPDQITESMGKVAKNFKIELTNIRGLADTINYLDDNAISKGSDIIDYLNRTSGVLSTVSMSAQQAAAFGSTLLTLGERAETASTATNAIVSRFAAATKGTKKFQSAVAEIGMSTKAIELGMTKDAVGTLLQVMEAVRNAPEQKRMGLMVELVGMEHADTLAKLVDKPDELNRQLELAGSDKAKGSMAREASARNDTMSAQVQMLNNRLFNLRAIVGSNLKSVFQDLAGALIPVVERITAFVKAHPALVGWILKGVIALGALIAVSSAILLPIGLLIAKAALMRFVFARLGASLNIFSGLARLAGGGLSVLSRAGTWVASAARMAVPVLAALGRGVLMLGRFLMATPIGLALTLLGTAAYMLYSRWADVKGGAVMLWQDLVSLKDRFFQAGSDLLSGLMNGITSRAAALRDGIVGIASSVAGWFKEKLGINSPSRVFMEFGGWISEGAALGIEQGQKLASVAAMGLAAVATAPIAMAAGSPLATIAKAPVAAVGSALGGAAAGASPASPAASAPSTYQINIYPAPGMNAQDIAAAVRAELDKRDRAKNSRVYSQYSDTE